MSDHTQRAEDASFRERLQTEVQDWQSEGLVHPDQAQAILARYGLAADETPGTLRRSKFVSILAVLGVILVGVGVILIIGANWEHIPKWARLALLMVSTASAYHFGYVMTYRSCRYPRVGMSLLLLGSLLWGASIFLVAQTYNLGGRGGETNAVLYWFLGVLPLAYILLSPLHMALALAVGSIWFGMMMNEGFLRGFHEYVLAFLPLGVLLYALSRVSTSRLSTEGLEPPYRWFGLIYIFAALYAFSFRGFWYWSDYGGETSNLLPIYIVLGLAGVASGGVLVSSDRRDRPSQYEGLALIVLLALTVGALLRITPGTAVYEASYTAMALFNLLLFAAEIGIIAIGWFRNLPGLANLGIFVFFVQVITRYFDLLGGMLSGGLMFIGAGVLLIFGGIILERSRRRLLDAMAQRRTA